MTNKNRPKIGVALSGASGRAVAHIGVLEVLQEEGIPVDYITACSSGTIVAGSYAVGTMSKLKEDWLRMDNKFVYKLFEISKTGQGLLSIEKAAEWVKTYVGDKRLEEGSPYLGFVCVDIVSGEPFLLSLGSIAKAGQASCAVPGLFDPVPWGNRLLVDGGLFSMVPIQQAYQLGANIVIGVDIAATRYIYKRHYVTLWRGYNFLKNSPVFLPMLWLYSLLSKFYEDSIKVVFYNQSDFLEEEVVRDHPSLFGILDKAMALAARQREDSSTLVCDIMLNPKVNDFGKINMEKSRLMYEEGRRVTKAAIPEIKRIIRDYQWRRQQVDVK